LGSFRFLFQLKFYILHLFKRKDEHSLHSPFLFDFYLHTVKSKSSFISEKFEQERIKLLKNKDTVSVNDFGAGSVSGSKQVCHIAKYSLATAEQAAFLAAIVYYLKPQNIIELGTSFGVTTSYLASSNEEIPVYTLEGNEEIGLRAKTMFSRLGLSQIHTVVGEIDDKLPEVLEKMPSVGLVFFDGNHKYEPTMRYFFQCMEKSNRQTVFVFHDIYWSGEMAKAWKEICSQATVMLSVDLYYFGLVFFRNNQPKQHFVLKF
jgi:predicted O-methyltransferase YrrM